MAEGFSQQCSKMSLSEGQPKTMGQPKTIVLEGLV
ncbi:hypothetical protein COLO4_28752 [Corchorus olitorius]|uniref:Uncharacterized protein n=1 Tax=Corchorus olitorius TaxID=93759 RepID=A0A1R3HIK3_9ROSI|nr:hypothetical protein COLO4_28752 [Corchorus olitorius]